MHAGKSHRAHQRPEVETIRHLYRFGDLCRQPEGPQAVWCGENRKAVGLKPPEIVILV